MQDESRKILTGKSRTDLLELSILRDEVGPLDPLWRCKFAAADIVKERVFPGSELLGTCLCQLVPYTCGVLGDLDGTGLLLALGYVYGHGARKYTDDGWRQGVRVSQMLDAFARHVLKFTSGLETHDLDHGQHHLVAAIWNCKNALWMRWNRPEWDDIKAGRLNPKWQSPAGGKP